MTHKSCKEFYDLSRILDELLLVSYKAKESLYFFAFLGGCMSLMASVFEGWGFIPVGKKYWAPLSFEKMSSTFDMGWKTSR